MGRGGHGRAQGQREQPMQSDGGPLGLRFCFVLFLLLEFFQKF